MCDHNARTANFLGFEVSIAGRQRLQLVRTKIFRTLSTSPINDEALFEMQNNVGIITLNHPRKLNVICRPMIKSIHSKLIEWEPHCSAVIIKGIDGKAFCAGGNVRASTENKLLGISIGGNVYKTIYLIGTYKKPYISICDGITMGGGLGLAIPGTYCVATENTLIAMPENIIGFFADVGSSYFLSRLAGKLGLFLALTGYRLKGVDVVKAGIATHYIRSADISKLIDELVKTEGGSIEQILQRNTIDVSKNEFSLEPHLNTINSCFAGATVEEIWELLEKDGSQFARSILELLSKMSPTSLKVTKRSFDLGVSEDLRKCLRRDYRLMTHALERTITSDLYEGVRALLVDKDKNPNWNPATLKDISDEMLNKLFAPFPQSEELQI